MPRIRLVHAADLHLGTPLRRESGDTARIVNLPGRGFGLAADAPLPVR